MKNLVMLVVLAATTTGAFAQGDLKTEKKAEQKTVMANDGTTKTTRKETRTMKSGHHKGHKMHHGKKAAM